MGATIESALFTPLKRIHTPGGDVLHGMKTQDIGFDGFGEVYFSFIEPGAIKGWKRHREMTLNLLVPVGAVKFVLFDDRIESEKKGKFEEITICSEKNYGRLTVPPGIWAGFQGIGPGASLVTNVANLPHDSAEVDRMEIGKLDFQWK